MTEKDKLLAEKDKLLAEKDKHTEEINSGKDKLLAGKDKLLAVKDKHTEEINSGKDKLLAEKDKIIALIYEKLADSNLRYLQTLGDISIRRVIEMVEKNDLYQESKKKLKATSSPETPVTRREIWSFVLKQKDEASARYPNLIDLSNAVPPINIPETITKLHSSASKGIHNAKIEKVLIDTSSLSSNEVYLHHIVKL